MGKMFRKVYFGIENINTSAVNLWPNCERKIHDGRACVCVPKCGGSKVGKPCNCFKKRTWGVAQALKPSWSLCLRDGVRYIVGLFDIYVLCVATEVLLLLHSNWIKVIEELFHVTVTPDALCLMKFIFYSIRHLYLSVIVMSFIHLISLVV